MIRKGKVISQPVNFTMRCDCFSALPAGGQLLHIAVLARENEMLFLDMYLSSKIAIFFPLFNVRFCLILNRTIVPSDFMMLNPGYKIVIIT